MVLEAFLLSYKIKICIQFAKNWLIW